VRKTECIRDFGAKATMSGFGDADVTIAIFAPSARPKHSTIVIKTAPKPIDPPKAKDDAHDATAD